MMSPRFATPWFAGMLLAGMLSTGMLSTGMSFALLLPMIAGAAKPAAPVAGVDYVVIDDGAPYQPLDGKIEVVEVFAYWCHHCADFQPMVDAWKRKLPADVRFSYVPAAFDRNDPFARGYFAAMDKKALGRTHDAMFRAIHTQGTLSQSATVDEIAGFYAQHGLDRQRMKHAMLDPAIDAKLLRARQFAVRSGVEGTPTLIINGKYRVRGRTFQDTLRIANQLIAMQRVAGR